MIEYDDSIIWPRLQIPYEGVVPQSAGLCPMGDESSITPIALRGNADAVRVALPTLGQSPGISAAFTRLPGLRPMDGEASITAIAPPPNADLAETLRRSSTYFGLRAPKYRKYVEQSLFAA